MILSSWFLRGLLSSAFAEQTDISIEAVTSVDPNHSISPSLILLLLMLLSFALLLSTLKPRSLNSAHTNAKNLFLSVKYRIAPQVDSHNNIPESIQNSCQENIYECGHLRDLSARSATLVCSRSALRGQILVLEFGSLPNFPTTAESIRAEVISCRPLGRDDDSFLVNIKFLNVEALTKSHLEQYLSYLLHGVGNNSDSGLLRA